MKKRNRIKGLTLIEIAIVVVVAGGFLAFALASMQRFADSSKFSLTQEKVEVVNKALLAHVKKSGDFPCPASLTAPSSDPSFGREKLTPGQRHCLTGDFSAQGVFQANGRALGGSSPLSSLLRIGTVPVRDLNLPDDFMFDAWGNRLLYAVSVNQTNGLVYPDSGVISVQDDLARSVTRIPESALYVLLSNGKDAKGAYDGKGNLVKPCGAPGTAMDVENCINDKLFVSGRYSIADGAPYFDDIVSYRAFLPDYSGSLCDFKLAFSDPENLSGLADADGCVKNERNIAKWETKPMGCTTPGGGAASPIPHPTLGVGTNCASANFSGEDIFSANYSSQMVTVYEETFTASVTGKMRIEAIIPIRYKLTQPDASAAPCDTVDPYVTIDPYVADYFCAGGHWAVYSGPWARTQVWGKTIAAVVRVNGVVVAITDLIKPGPTNAYLSGGGAGTTTVDGAVSTVFASTDIAKGNNYTVKINIVSGMANMPGPPHYVGSTGGKTAWAGTMWNDKYLSLGTVDIIELQN